MSQASNRIEKYPFLHAGRPQIRPSETVVEQLKTFLTFRPIGSSGRASLAFAVPGHGGESRMTSQRISFTRGVTLAMVAGLVSVGCGGGKTAQSPISAGATTLASSVVTSATTVARSTTTSRPPSGSAQTAKTGSSLINLIHPFAGKWTCAFDQRDATRSSDVHADVTATISFADATSGSVVTHLAGFSDSTEGGHRLFDRDETYNFRVDHGQLVATWLQRDKPYSYSGIEAEDQVFVVNGETTITPTKVNGGYLFEWNSKRKGMDSNADNRMMCTR